MDTASFFAYLWAFKNSPNKKFAPEVKASAAFTIVHRQTNLATLLFKEVNYEESAMLAEVRVT